MTSVTLVSALSTVSVGFGISLSDISVTAVATFAQLNGAESLGLAKLDLAVLGELQAGDEGRGDGRSPSRRIGEARRKEGFERLPVDGNAQHPRQTLRRVLHREELHRLDLVCIGVLRSHLCA